MASSVRNCLQTYLVAALVPTHRHFLSKISRTTPTIRSNLLNKYHPKPLASRSRSILSLIIQNLIASGRVSFSLIIPVVMAASGENQKLIEEVESLHDKKEFAKEYELLIPLKDSSDAEILWRLARCSTDFGKEQGEPNRKTKIYDAFEYIKKALELDDKNFACHKWYGILLNYTAEYEGTTQRIKNSYIVKEHFTKAIELNPQDSTSMYCLGMWCFLFADMGWIQRKAASALFASPPTSTYQEALDYFQRADKADPGFYNQNTVMIGKTMIKMGNKESAKEYLLNALKYEDKTVDDTNARKEATDLLKGLGVKV